MLNNIVYLGLVGAGKLGSYHIQKLLNKENCNFVGIYDTDIMIMESHKSEYGVNVLACRESIDDDVKSYLVEKGIQAFRRVARSDLNMLARACDAKLVNSIQTSRTSDLGDLVSSKNINIDGKDFWVVESNGKAATIIAKGSTVDILGEVERCFDDSLGVSVQLIEDGFVVCGGGASYVALARRLRRYAETIPGREQLAIEAYADAIEVIVRVLAE